MTEATSHPDAGAMSGGDRVGQLISGRYRIVALLGEGGMGAVYLAEHTHMKKRFALKLLHAEMAQSEEILARFKREAEAAAHIEHPNVVAATDFGKTEDGNFFLVLEYIDGTSLRKVVEEGALPAVRALRIVRQIALALGRAHEAGIVHRDLKPENVMLVRKGDDPDFVKVLDFGVARFEPREGRGDGQQPLTRIGTIMGTPEYMAPEQALGEPVTAVSDLYALGVVLYEMLTGRHPFDGDQMTMLSMHIVAPIPEMAARAPQVTVPPPVEALARRLLEKDAKARPESARALVDAIDEAARAAGLELPVTVPSERMSLANAPSSSRLAVGPPSSAFRADAGVASTPDALANTAVGLPAVARPGVNAVTVRAARGALTPRQAIERLFQELSTLTKLPVRVLVTIAATIPLFVITVVVVFLVVRKSPTPAGGDGGLATASASARVTPAPPERLRAAAAKGGAALEELATEFPSDAAVLRELAFAYDREGRTTDALATIKRIVDASAGAIPRECVRVVSRAASKFETADDAFALLEGPLGADGAEALFELFSTPTVAEATRVRAAKSLLKPQVKKNAAPGIALIVELGSAATCEERKEILVRDGENADARALPLLRGLKKNFGCGRRNRYDCNPCLRGADNALDRAIRAAELKGS